MKTIYLSYFYNILTNKSIKLLSNPIFESILLYSYLKNSIFCPLKSKIFDSEEVQTILRLDVLIIIFQIIETSTILNVNVHEDMRNV